MGFFKKKTPPVWHFDTKKEALSKIEFLKNPDDYETVQNRENGKIVKGWTVRKRS